MHMQLIPYWHAGTVDDTCRFCNQNCIAEHVFKIHHRLEYIAHKRAACTLVLFRIDKVRAPMLRETLGLPATANPPLIDNPFTRGL